MFMFLSALCGAWLLYYWTRGKAQDSAKYANDLIPEEQRLRERLDTLKARLESRKGGL